MLRWVTSVTESSLPAATAEFTKDVLLGVGLVCVWGGVEEFSWGREEINKELSDIPHHSTGAES